MYAEPRTGIYLSAGIGTDETKIPFQTNIRDIVVCLYANYRNWLTRNEKLPVKSMLTCLAEGLDLTPYAEPDATEAEQSVEAHG